MPAKPDTSHIIYKVNGFRHRRKIAAFDLDGTLIKPLSGADVPKDIDDWQWLTPAVPLIVSEYYNRGYCIMIFTNQTYEWRLQQAKNIVDKLNLPIKACILFRHDYRKPEKQVWIEEVVKTWDKEKSFFCGDALGRPADWADVDKLFGENIGIMVKSPEEIFGDFRQ